MPHMATEILKAPSAQLQALVPSKALSDLQCEKSWSDHRAYELSKLCDPCLHCLTSPMAVLPYDGGSNIEPSTAPLIEFGEVHLRHFYVRNAVMSHDDVHERISRTAPTRVDTCVFVFLLFVSWAQETPTFLVQ